MDCQNRNLTFKQEAWRASLQSVLDGLNLAGNHTKDLCLDAAARQCSPAYVSFFTWHQL